MRTRFAPSPNGALHLGHAFSALCAHDFARTHYGAFHLRIEDIDGTRSRAEHVGAIFADLEWLGLKWDGLVQYQSGRVARYVDALERLKAMGLVYRCVCSRGDIAEVLKTTSVPHGPDGPHYPGTCRVREVDEDAPYVWRLDMAKAVELAGSLRWTDLAAGEQLADPMLFGDVVLWRKDAPASYHLAATVDDAADGISHVVRGQGPVRLYRNPPVVAGASRPARAGLLASSIVARCIGRKAGEEQIVARIGGRARRARTVRALIDNLRKGDPAAWHFACPVPR